MGAFRVLRSAFCVGLRDSNEGDFEEAGMHRTRVWLCALIGSALVVACSDDSGSVGPFDTGGADAGSDVGAGDAGLDAIGDASDDVSDDTGATDAGEDATDTSADVAEDTTPDVIEDASEDAGDDAGADADTGSDADASGPTCEDVDCGPYGTCEEGDDGPICVCDDGFEDLGEGCQDIDECATDESLCGANETCVNQPGEYLCICAEGYAASGGACLDIDECALGDMCGDGFACRNLPGSMRCDCEAPNVVDGDTCRPMRVLHVHDHFRGDGPIFEALEVRGVDVTTVYLAAGEEITSIADALDEAEEGTDLAIVNFPGADYVVDGTDDALVAWLDEGRRLIVYTYQLDELTAVTRRIGIDVTSFFDPRAVQTTDAGGYDLFAQRDGTPTIGDSWRDDNIVNGFDITIARPDTAFAVAEFVDDGGGPALVLSPERDLAVFGFSPSEAAGFGAVDRVDADVDGTSDVAELVNALIDLMFETPVLVIDDHRRAVMRQVLGIMGLPWVAATTPEEVTAARDRWEPSLLMVTRDADTVPETDARIVGFWHETELPLVYNAWDLDEFEDVQSALGVRVARSLESFEVIDTYTLGIPSEAMWFWQFASPIDPIDLSDSYLDSGDVLTPGDGDVVLAHFEIPDERPAPASIWSAEDRTIINGINLSEHRTSDTDADGTPDIFEFAINQIRFLIAR